MSIILFKIIYHINFQIIIHIYNKNNFHYIDSFIIIIMESAEGNLQNLVNDKNLKWIFVGGKGGVGKTTTSSSLSVLLSKTRENVEYSNAYKPILKCKFN